VRREKGRYDSLMLKPEGERSNAVKGFRTTGISKKGKGGNRLMARSARGGEFTIATFSKI